VKKSIALLVSALLFAALAFAVYLPVALAHAEIAECAPAIDGTVETAPDKLVCKASQGMRAEGSSLAVFDSAGTQVDKGDSAVDLTDPDRLTISVSLDTTNMPDGVYTVRWTTVSAEDGDEASGEFKFTVGHAMDMGHDTTPAASSDSHAGEDHSIATGMVEGHQVTLQMISPPKGAALPAGDVKMEATVEGITLGENAHLHFYVDDALALMGTGTQTSHTVKLEPGSHDLEIRLATAEHDDVLAVHVHVTVEPAQQATATAAPTEAAATPTPAPTEPAPTAAAAPEPTPSATLPGTGGTGNSVWIALVAVVGVLVAGVGVFVGARARR
jgi:methionine-rich copper-binding protein CopC